MQIIMKILNKCIHTVQMDGLNNKVKLIDGKYNEFHSLFSSIFSEISSDIINLKDRLKNSEEEVSMFSRFKGYVNNDMKAIKDQIL